MRQGHLEPTDNDRKWIAACGVCVWRTETGWLNYAFGILIAMHETDRGSARATGRWRVNFIARRRMWWTICPVDILCIDVWRCERRIRRQQRTLLAARGRWCCICQSTHNNIRLFRISQWRRRIRNRTPCVLWRRCINRLTFDFERVDVVIATNTNQSVGRLSEIENVNAVHIRAQIDITESSHAGMHDAT